MKTAFFLVFALAGAALLAPVAGAQPPLPCDPTSCPPPQCTFWNLHYLDERYLAECDWNGRGYRVLNPLGA